MQFAALDAHQDAPMVFADKNGEQPDSRVQSVDVEQEIVPNNVLVNEDDYSKKLEAAAKARYLTPLEAREHISKLFKNEVTILDLLYGMEVIENGKLARKASPNMFFLDVLAVAPNRFRPLAKMDDMVYEHPQNIYLSDILKTNQYIVDLHRSVKDGYVCFE